MRRILKLCLPIVLLMHAAAAMAVAVHVVIDTHALPATGFVVAFDLVDGGPPANTVALSHLATDGSFAAATFTGDATASAGTMTLGDAQFFNEILLPVSSATALSFDIDMTLAAPASGSLPDAFALFLLDPTTLLPLVMTTDPSGAQSLLTIQSGDSPLGPLTTFADSGGALPATWTVTSAIPAVPEPAGAALMLAGLMWLFVRRGPRRSLARFIGLAVLVLPGLVLAAIHVRPGGGTSSPHDGAKWETAYSTIVGNSAPAGGGAWLDTFSRDPAAIHRTVSVVNTAIVGNAAPLGSAIVIELFATPPTSVFHDVVTLAGDKYASSFSNTPSPSPLGAGGFTVPDPVFVAAASGDYRLGGSSPLIDRGDSAPINAYIAAGGAATDLAGQPRIAGAAVDVGAHETAAAGVVNVTSQVSLRLGGLVFDRATRRYTQVATLANSSGGLLPGPISLVFDGLPAGVTVSGMTNVTMNQLPAGSPYIDVLATDFAAGALMTLNLRFNDPFNTAIRYVPRVLAGAGTR